MSAVFIVAVFATFAASNAACTGGAAPPGSKLIYSATRTISRVGNAPVICSYNLYKGLDMKIDRVDIMGAGWSCRSRGPGDFKVEILVTGGDSRTFTGNIWASGKDINKVHDPKNQYGWGCILQRDYTPSVNCLIAQISSKSLQLNTNLYVLHTKLN